MNPAWLQDGVARRSAMLPIGSARVPNPGRDRLSRGLDRPLENAPWSVLAPSRPRSLPETRRRRMKRPKTNEIRTTVTEAMHSGIRVW